MLQVGSGPIILDHHLAFAITKHARLGEANLRRLGRREEDVVVRGVLRHLEFVRRQVPAKMIAAARGHMQCAKDFFVLDVAARGWQILRSEAQLAEFARRGIRNEKRIVRGARLADE